MPPPKKIESYTSDSVEVNEGLDGVRLKPAMYIGGVGPQGIQQLLKEAVDNAVDEFFAGRNKSAQIFLSKKLFIVADEAEGIPVGPKTLKMEDGRPYKLSTLTAIFTLLHTGGKFGSSAYGNTGGTHGVGIKTITALSKRLDVWTCRRGVWYHQKFAKGKKVTNLKKGAPVPETITRRLPVTPVRGTVLAWVPDPEIFGEGTTIDEPSFFSYIEDKHFINSGIKFTVRNIEGTKVFHNKKGPGAYIEHYVEDKVDLLGKPIIIELPDHTLAVQASTGNDDQVSSFVNSIKTVDNGTHVEGMWAAFHDALKKHNMKKHKYTLRDLKVGMIGFYDFRMSGSSFSGQTKGCLVSDVKMDVKKDLMPVFDSWFNKNKAVAKVILDRATDVFATRTKSKELMDVLNSAKTNRKRGAILPGILDIAIRAKPEDVELYIVEGDSAAGTAKYARDKTYQEVLRLSGKPINVAKATLAKSLSSQPVQHILTAVGYDLVKKQLNPRVGKVMLLADADHDGHHITLLVLTMLWEFCPELFHKDMVYVVDSPLYMARDSKKKAFFADDLAGIKSQTSAKVTITRIKGWGEVNENVLNEIAFNPKTRKLFRVKPVFDKKLEMFKRVVGEDTAVRKKILGVVDSDRK